MMKTQDIDALILTSANKNANIVTKFVALVSTMLTNSIFVNKISVRNRVYSAGNNAVALIIGTMIELNK